MNLRTAARYHAQWRAVALWSRSVRLDGLPDFAVSEMLCHARRHSRRGDELMAGNLGANQVDRTVVALTAAQAAGTDPVLLTNPERRSLTLLPSADCRLALSAGATRGLPLSSTAINRFTGAGCPTNALYVIGLSSGSALIIWEA